jgi:hypothetical protein
VTRLAAEEAAGWHAACIDRVWRAIEFNKHSRLRLLDRLPLELIEHGLGRNVLRDFFQLWVGGGLHPEPVGNRGHKRGELRHFVLGPPCTGLRPALIITPGAGVPCQVSTPELGVALNVPGGTDDALSRRPAATGLRPAESPLASSRPPFQSGKAGERLAPALTKVEIEAWLKPARLRPG